MNSALATYEVYIYNKALISCHTYGIKNVPLLLVILLQTF
ncbi:hypothetical protein rpr22_0575 [Rickettsia prowazekii str. Rp22]|uniref:Uncharacterized protein n=1 Tax=Rickettsia prowazekii (strain Rp22) TaxID=449216 RepID=D5AXE2_RICPP|nr:hypothetical protein rpr22_0575 [Rickettsia prowazekii str. Rp22]